MPKAPANLSIWTVTDGKIGMVNQTLGLAEAVALACGGATISEKRVTPKMPWRWIPPSLWPPGVTGIARESDPLVPPWPDIVISCGRHAVGPTMAVKENSAGASFIIHVQHPRVPLSKFDLIAAPRHDRLEGQNVIPIIGAMHRVTQAKLDCAAASYADTLNHLPRPRVAVLIGGANRSYRMTESVARRLGRDLAYIADQNGAGLMVTASRRTGLDNENLLRAAIGAPNKASNAVFWDNQGPNPYFAYLALADALIITCDSVNMISEAAATGKPVYIVPLEGGDAKFSAFHQMLYDAGIARPFEGTLDHWSYEVPDEPKRVATEILRRMEAMKT
jgi:uncharacterized protein